MSNEPHVSNRRGKEFLQAAFASEQKCLAATLESSDSIIHNGDRGEVNEKHFIDLFRHYLPNRYSVDKASILDSKGEVSDSIDLVVYDRQYTPTLLDNDKHKYIPAEAVYAIFECKPTINKTYLKYAADKAASVRKLHRTSVDIYHAGGKHLPKKPFDIIAGILALNVEWSEGLGKTFEINHKSFVTDDHALHFGLAVTGSCFDMVYENDKPNYTVRNKSDNAVAFFMFRLLHRLQLLGTVTAPDWNAYADQLSELTIHQNKD